MKAKPEAVLFLLALGYGFLSRFAGDILQAGLFQAPLVVLLLAIAACLAFNVFYSLRPVQSGIRLASWLIMVYFGYYLAGMVHNFFQPALPYDLTGSVILAGPVVAVIGFVIGLVIPLLFVRNRRPRLSNHA